QPGASPGSPSWPAAADARVSTTAVSAARDVLPIDRAPSVGTREAGAAVLGCACDELPRSPNRCIDSIFFPRREADIASDGSVARYFGPFAPALHLRDAKSLAAFRFGRRASRA